MSSNLNALRPEGNARRLDLRAVGNAVLGPFVLWVAVVIVMVFIRRQPGVVCLTPLAWSLACWVGLRCVLSSRSGEKSARLREAGLAGAVFGLLQGILFTVIAPFMGTIRPDERQKALVLAIVMMIVGAVVSAVLSVAVGSAQDRRRTAK